jgi:C4-type Zn-finger protein
MASALVRMAKPLFKNKIACPVCGETNDLCKDEPDEGVGGKIVVQCFTCSSQHLIDQVLPEYSN